MTRKIGVTTGGGDCPGLNAVLRAMVLHGQALGISVIGIEDGFDGLLTGRQAKVRPLTVPDVADVLDRGGTILGTSNRGNPFAYPDASGGTIDRSDEVISAARHLGVECMVTIGGEGTQSIAVDLQKKGLPIIGVPKTIDNDLPATYETFGFGTAVQVVTHALDRLRTTAESHERTMVVEVMGRDAGFIALHAGIAGGAHAILLPELPYDPAAVARALRARFNGESPFAIVVVAEGAHPRGEATPDQSVVGLHAGHARVHGGAGRRAAHLVADLMPGVEFRVTVLGHVQRGGTPTAADRVLATRLGVEAVHAAYHREHGVLVSWQPPDIVRVPLTDAVKQARRVDLDSQIIEHARALGICLGDPVP